MAFANWLWSAVGDRFDLTFGAAAAYGAPAMAGALVCSLAWYLWRRRSRGRPVSARGFFRTIFAGRIVWNPSSIVDVKMWVLNGLVLAGGYGYLAFGNVFCRDATLAGLDAGFGARAPAAWPAWTVLAMATLFELLAYELAYWFGHFLFHRIPALWEFHKVHHSAEVMTTFTELRQHPVEILAFMNLIAIATGAVFGVMTYLFGPGVQPFTLLDGNILLMAVPRHLRPPAPQPHVDPVQRRRRPYPAEPGASPDPPFRQSRALGQEPRLRAGGVGLGVRHALYSGRRAREDPLRRRPDRGRIQHRAAQHPAALRAFRRACRARASPSRAAAAPRGRARLARLSCGRLVERQ